MARNAELQTEAAQQYGRSMVAAAEAMRMNAEAEVRQVRFEVQESLNVAPSPRPLVEEIPKANSPAAEQHRDEEITVPD